jgi:hypothetical protein
MTMKKRSIALLPLVLLCLSVAPAPAAAMSAIPDESATVQRVAAENAGLMARLRAAAATCVPATPTRAARR